MDLLAERRLDVRGGRLLLDGLVELVRRREEQLESAAGAGPAEAHERADEVHIGERVREHHLEENRGGALRAVPDIKLAHYWRNRRLMQLRLRLLLLRQSLGTQHFLQMASGARIVRN